MEQQWVIQSKISGFVLQNIVNGNEAIWTLSKRSAWKFSSKQQAEQYRDINFDISVGEVPSIKTLENAITYAKHKGLKIS